MSKQKITAADAAALAVSIARAAGGDVTGLAAQIPKWIKPIAAFVGGFLIFMIIVAIIISNPLVILGYLCFSDTSTEMGAFYAGEITNAEQFVRTLEMSEYARAEERSDSLKQGYGIGNTFTWNTNKSINIDLNREELLTIYSVLYDDYSGAGVDWERRSKMRLPAARFGSWGRVIVFNGGFFMRQYIIPHNYKDNGRVFNMFEQKAFIKALCVFIPISFLVMKLPLTLNVKLFCEILIAFPPTIAILFGFSDWLVWILHHTFTKRIYIYGGGHLAFSFSKTYAKAPDASRINRY